MATIYPRENQSIDQLIKAFRSEVEKEGILTKLKSKRHFIKPSRIRYEHDQKVSYKMSKHNDETQKKKPRRSSSKKHSDENKSRG